MDIGFLMAPTALSGDLTEAARLVESLGYESLWIPEHQVIPANMKTPFPFTPDNKLPEHYATWADPFVGLAVAAAVTKKIKLGTGICLLPEREPLITAKAVASLDLFSGGRVLLGVGAGWLREETEAMGAKFGTRWKQTRETVRRCACCGPSAKPHTRAKLFVSRLYAVSRSRCKNRIRQ